MFWTAYNTGYGFITFEDRSRFEIVGYPCDIWKTDESQAAKDWAARVAAKPITKAAAQALLDALPAMTDPMGNKQARIVL